MQHIQYYATHLFFYPMAGLVRFCTIHTRLYFLMPCSRRYVKNTAGTLLGRLYIAQHHHTSLFMTHNVYPLLDRPLKKVRVDIYNKPTSLGPTTLLCTLPLWWVISKIFLIHYTNKTDKFPCILTGRKHTQRFAMYQYAVVYKEIPEGSL